MPTIDEFHIGFRYLDVDGPKVYEGGEIPDALVHELRDEDLLELGWREVDGQWTIEFDDEIYYLRIGATLCFIHMIAEGTTFELYSGRIRNFNELQRLMDRLDIIHYAY